MSHVNKATQVNWRQSSSWLHTWLGLFFGWVLFMVFVTGTLSVFREELTNWLQPEVLHVQSTDNLTSVKNAVNFMSQQGVVSQWSINLPDRSPTIAIRWFAENEKPSKRGGKSAHIDPSTGTEVKPRTTRFIDFLYRMHFELYNLPRSGARWFIGIATAAMFIALITGVIIHKRIFVDFFTFRPKKGPRSWLDLHNAVSVLALPFHLMITFSGLLLFMYLLIPWGIQAAYDGDAQQYRKEGGGRGGGHAIEQAILMPANVTAVDSSMQVQLAALMHDAQQRWPNGVGSIRVTDPSGQPSFTLTQRGANSIVTRGSSEAITYNSRNQKGTLRYIDQGSIGNSRAIYNVLTAWHLMRFAEPFQRWLYFIGGIAGSIMVASGLLLWSKRREKKYEGKPLPGNLRWVSLLNVTAIMGLFVAFIITCWANRIIGYDETKTLSSEIVIFFSSWSIFLIYAWVRHWIYYNPKGTWQESLFFCAISYAGLVLFDLVTILPNISSGIGLTTLLSTDFVLALLALSAFFSVRGLNKEC